MRDFMSNTCFRNASCTASLIRGGVNPQYRINLEMIPGIHREPERTARMPPPFALASSAAYPPTCFLTASEILSVHLFSVAQSRPSMSNRALGSVPE